MTKRRTYYTAVKDIRKLFGLKKEIKGIKDIVLRNIFEYEKKEENHYKSIRVNYFWSNNYIEYKSNGDRKKTLSVKEYLDKIRLYLKDIMNDLKQSDT